MGNCTDETIHAVVEIVIQVPVVRLIGTIEDSMKFLANCVQDTLADMTVNANSFRVERDSVRVVVGSKSSRLRQVKQWIEITTALVGFFCELWEINPFFEAI